ncbi:MAG: hypothetical protein JWM59_1177 [Verrucomicrobiales bacterium]|nr:hypothetical protein [Verrucomicrobiales bacterium]
MMPAFRLHFPAPAAAAIALALLSGCAMGPDYQKPDTAAVTPAAWRWQPAVPRDTAPRGEWWTVFRDADLNTLESRALAGSQTLKAGVARVLQARANARAEATGFFPDIRLNSSAKREQTSGNLPSPVPVSIPASRINTFDAGFDLSYEIDFWGKVRRSWESARASADASEADFHHMLLTLTGDVAMNYFSLRAADAELAALRRTIGIRENAFRFTQMKFDAGTVGRIDLARSRTELDTARAELADVQRQRRETADTLALLCGEPASNFDLPERPLNLTPPAIPAGIPAHVLERRPDVAAAERDVAAKNAQIGVAQAAYFPAISLTGSSGRLSNETGTLFTADSKVWTIGPSLSLPITGYALIGANVRRVKAAREESIANYRQAVLTAVKDVETSLTQIRYRAEQATAQSEALKSATTAADLIRTQYESGTIGQLDLLESERTRLQVERQSAQLSAQRLIATVRLIKALGGQW